MKFNFKNVSKGTWVRIISLILLAINQIATSVFNYQLLPFSDEEVYEGVSTILTIILMVVNTWKNNSFTEQAQEADALLKQRKGLKK